PARSQEKAQNAEKISERPIQLETKAGKIDGTLDLPAGPGPFPVVIIITGSGPVDRDGNAPGVKTDNLKQLGQGLAGKGIAALRRQFGKNLPTKALKEKGNQVIDELVAGRTVADIPKALEDILRPSVQPVLISYFKYDPAREIARLEVPVMIVQGTTDLQTPAEEAKLLAKAKQDAQLCVIEGMNHVLKRARTMEEQGPAYIHPSVPLEPMLVETVS